MDYKFKESKAPVKKIEAIQFGVLSPEYIRATSVTQEQFDPTGKLIPAGIFDQNNIYDQKTKKPVIGGVNDPRMGSINDIESPGYFGHIELAVPIYHYCFLQTILNILKAVSFWSSKILVSDKDFQWIAKSCKKRKRLSEIIKISQKIKICPHTKKSNPIFTRDSLKILIEFPDTNIKRTLSSREVFEVFEKISDEDAVKIGLNPKFCRPEHLLLKVLAVPPNHVRPTVYMNSSQKCEDDLTHKISDILKANIALGSAIKNKEKPHVIEQFENLLQYHVSTFFDNKIPGQKPSQQRSGKPLKTLRQRLVGKEGRVRGNLMGKRVDFSARSVITADPNIDMDQVGVPLEIALNLTVSEKVTQYSIKKLQNIIKNGPHKHPGAKYVILENKKKIDLNYNKEDIILKIGDVVERHLDNDDVVVFNRQPSLHKMSIMGHRVKVLKNKTFRLNLAVVSPYNADFDGDEMNMHVPRGQTSMSEIENLMMVPYMIVSPQSNKPVMGIIQDSLLSTYLLTSRDVFIERAWFINGILEYLNVSDKIKEVLKKPALLISSKLLTTTSKKQEYKQLWTGKQYFSCILDPRINIKRTSNGAPENDDEMSYTDTRVVISKGFLLKGRIDKKTIGTSEGSLIHTMFNDIGPYETMFFMNRLQKLANYWILNNCFTIGITDTLINDYTKVHEILDSVKKRVNGIIDNQQSNNKLEQEINAELNSARDEAGNYVQTVLNYKNNFKSTVLSGSKGNNLNISQIIACLGQQNIEGHRVPYGFRKRSLPHYPKNDVGYESRGFIENSYISALSPQEFFFHAMAGREGIIDTACKTSLSGYTQRRIVKSLEDVMVKYDGTVRDSYENIVQYRYGEDGIDATFIENQEFKTLTMSNKEMSNMYEHVGTQTQELKEEFKQLIKDRDFLRLIAKNREPHYSKATDKMFPMPVNIQRLLNLRKYIPVEETDTIISCVDIVKEVSAMLNELKATELFNIHTRHNLASKLLYGLSEKQFYILLEEIKLKYYNSLVHAGEMCGILAAQSISELTTQLTLNSFHSTGISAKNVTLGLPRLTELINVAKKIKSPSLKLFIKENEQKDSEQKVSIESIEYKILKDYILRSYLKCVEINDLLFTEQIKINKMFSNEALSNYYLKLDINPALLESTKITMTTLYNKIITDKRIIDKCIMDNIKIMINDDNSECPSIIIFQIIDDTDNKDTIETLKNIEIEYINKVHINGIQGITQIFIENKDFMIPNNETGSFEKVRYKCIETEGSCLEYILSVSNIEHCFTSSNDINEINKVFGIEAAKKALFNELRMVLSFDGSYINYRHLALLTDIMTYKGSLMSLTRHGINKNDTGTLVKCSFEETVEILTESAIYSQKDQIKGVSENIMLGQHAPCGTGTFDILLDENLIYDEYIPSSPKH
jgi:DNA-directed RNA polymerase II subunit RPB1